MNFYETGQPGNPISSDQRITQVARGVVPNTSILSSFGQITTIGAVTDHILWPYVAGTSLVVPASSGVQMSVVSSSASDGVSGTGIRSVVIIYLDSSLNQTSEVVVMNGTTPVTTVATDVRFIQCAYMLSYGSGKAAAGNISISNGGVVYSYIGTGARRCSSSARRVPAGKQLIVNGIYAGASSGTATAGVMVNLVATQIFDTDASDAAITYPFASLGLQDNSVTMSSIRLMFPAGVIVAMEVTTDKASIISGGFTGWVEDIPV